jgi:hypothetical protein
VKIYYLDEPLNDEELAFVRESLASREGLSSIQDLEQIRVPMVLPAAQGGRLDESIEAQTQRLQQNLKNSGLSPEVGGQIVWVMPRETHWGAKFQLAIADLTGFYPYVLQRWRPSESGELVRGNPRLIDGHGMMGGKD